MHLLLQRLDVFAAPTTTFANKIILCEFFVFRSDRMEERAFIMGWTVEHFAKKHMQVRLRSSLDFVGDKNEKNNSRNGPLTLKLSYSILSPDDDPIRTAHTYTHICDTLRHTYSVDAIISIRFIYFHSKSIRIRLQVAKGIALLLPFIYLA